jgi:hypothetical protein
VALLHNLCAVALVALVTALNVALWRRPRAELRA